ncbi:MAG: hypothetical protein P4M04_04195 [Acidobacteriota bacterium]|nr:hypothetical protein [Acidobacteriota bacterium]
MATVSVPRQRLPWLRSKNLLFVFIGLMMAYVLYHNERFLINSADPAWQHYQPFECWLLPHGLAGAVALVFVEVRVIGRAHGMGQQRQGNRDHSLDVPDLLRSAG